MLDMNNCMLTKEGEFRIRKADGAEERDIIEMKYEAETGKVGGTIKTYLFPHVDCLLS